MASQVFVLKIPNDSHGWPSEPPTWGHFGLVLIPVSLMEVEMVVAGMVMVVEAVIASRPLLIKSILASSWAAAKAVEWILEP
jgi:hypothetical protein